MRKQDKYGLAITSVVVVLSSYILYRNITKKQKYSPPSQIEVTVEDKRELDGLSKFLLDLTK